MDINYQTLVGELIKQLAPTTEKAVTGPTQPPNHIYGHDAGGLFNTPCVSRRLFSAVPLPRKGLQALLPVMPSQISSPQVGIITGVTSTDEDAETNDAITGECGRGPSAGKLKYCVINDYPFGDFSRSMSAINIRKAGRMACRTDTFDYQVLGNPFNMGAAQQNVPGFPGLNSIGNVANNEASKALFELGVAWSRDFARIFYTGNPAGAWDEWTMPFRGMDLLINDGYQDIISGNLCTRVDSYVADFTAFTGGTADIESNPGAIVQAIVEITNLLFRRAVQMGVDPARWVLTMPYNLFRKLCYLWPCAFYTSFCTPATGYTGNLDAAAQQALTQSMLSGQYLLVGTPDNPDGRIAVVLDDAITESTGDDADLESSIRWVCTHILSNYVVTYMEYFDYNGMNGPMEIAKQVGQGGNYQTYDNGRFLAHFIAPEGTCVQVAFYMEPRLRVDTPWLCARLDNVEYSPIVPQDSAFPGDDTYYDGGNYGPNPGADNTCATILSCEDDAPGSLIFTLDSLITCADAPFNTHVLITVKSGTDAGLVIPGLVTAGDGTTSVTVGFSGPFAAVTCSDVDTFVDAEICCNFGDAIQ